MDLFSQNTNTPEQGEGIRFISMDPSMANTGFVWGYIKNGEVKLKGWYLTKTEKTKNKQVRASSDTITRCRDIFESVMKLTDEWKPQICFAETPSGSQSYNGAKSYGISCFAIALMTPEAIEVTPIEVKKATVGKKTASKDEMMDWALKKHPYFHFLKNKKGELIKASMEHVADCVAIVHAGILTTQFKQVEKFIK